MAKLLRIITAVAGVLVVGLCAQAQVPSEVLLRVLYMRVPNKTGSAFILNRNGRQYLVTAKHMVESLPRRNAEVEFYRYSGWHKSRVNILNCKNPVVDIAVLSPSEPLRANVPDIDTGSKGAFLGQEVFFVGFPHGLYSPYEVEGYPIPFVKHGNVSVFNNLDPTASFWYVDGLNNPGFSGGPIVYQDLTDHKWKIAGVVMGFETEPAMIKVGKRYVNTKYLVNSGILIGYDIEHALETIDRSAPQH